MQDVRRGVALAALAVACVLGGPTRELVAAAERVAAVQVVEQPGRRGRRTDRVPGRARHHRPAPTRPRR